VETKSLDGETNLKDKSVSSDLFKLYMDDTGFSALEKRIILKYEAPNPYLYRFYGEVINSVGHNSPIS
jgi:phospholipid-transporting ATPase